MRTIVSPFLSLLMASWAMAQTGEHRLTFAQVADPRGDGPDGKGNTQDDTWQFWFELAHERGRFQRLETHSTKVPKAGIARKIRGPIASLLPSPEDTEGWIFHRDWDGRFEGIWGDRKLRQVIAYPYVEKTSHCAVAITWTAPESGNYDVSGGVTDLQVAPEAKQHDGVEWQLVIAEKNRVVHKIGRGDPVGDGHGRPDSGKFAFSRIAIKKGEMVRLEIHPRAWWGTDITRIDDFVIQRAKEREKPNVK